MIAAFFVCHSCHWTIKKELWELKDRQPSNWHRNRKKIITSNVTLEVLLPYEDVTLNSLPKQNLTSHANITRLETCGASEIDHRISWTFDTGRIIQFLFYWPRFMRCIRPSASGRSKIIHLHQNTFIEAYPLW
jgi:hypothetical protein